MAGKTLAQYAAEAQRQPFVVDPGDGEHAPLVIEPPTVAAILAIEEAGSSREALQRIAGDQYEPLMAVLGGQPAGVLESLLGDMRRWFGLGNSQASPGS
ncbi:MAG TPA: hypothetical protein VH641_14815 [Streptosporangiaceae bacterium]|jgi:hypothetical protein